MNAIQTPIPSHNRTGAQKRINHLLGDLVASGRERGLQVAAYLGGKLVVDAWAGHANAATGTPVEGDTLFPVFSVSKGIAATIIHRLVDQGTLSYEMRIAEVWPEFAANGKEGITLRQALNHTAGIPQMPPGIGYAELGDWAAMCSAIARLKPLWPPGTRAEYHAMTYGWIIGETARRADGRSFPELLRGEICIPLGIEDSLYIGIPDGAKPAVAVLEECHENFVPADDALPQSIPGWLGPLHAMMNRADAQRACIPATSGIMSARALARHYAALLPGGVDGIELLQPQRRSAAIELQKIGQSEAYSKWLLGYGFVGKREAPDSPVTAFGNSGYGGSIGYADLARGLAVGITKNLFNKENTIDRILEELAWL